MLIRFFETLRLHKVPVSIRELLDLLQALEQRLAYADVDEFYHLAKVCMVKDERHFDKYDRAFAHFFEGLDSVTDLFPEQLPEDWLRKEVEKHLSKEAMEELEALGDLNDLMEAFQERLKEQHKRHQGGNKMIGTGGTSPFGAYGYNPAGFRMAGPSRHKRAVKVWEKREYRNLDDSIELGTRNIKVALRRLRQFARTGATDELDLDDTIRSTAQNAGYLDIKMVPERHNAVKVLLFFDVGGSMDPYVNLCEELFSAARTEFKHMEYFYFHNCIYEAVWKDNGRRRQEALPTWDLLHRYGDDYRVIFVGDASMSPYEVDSVGGSVEHWNEEPGRLWLQRITDKFNKVAWFNPVAEDNWNYTTSTVWIKDILAQRMYPLTLSGIERGIKEALMS